MKPREEFAGSARSAPRSYLVMTSVRAALPIAWTPGAQAEVTSRASDHPHFPPPKAARISHRVVSSARKPLLPLHLRPARVTAMRSS
jgi:hypothetical protein